MDPGRQTGVIHQASFLIGSAGQHQRQRQIALLRAGQQHAQSFPAIIPHRLGGGDSQHQAVFFAGRVFFMPLAQHCINGMNSVIGNFCVGAEFIQQGFGVEFRKRVDGNPGR